MIVNMLHNLSHRYSNHNSNIKYVGLTIKYIDSLDYESIHYIISLNVVSSFMIFNNFDYMFHLKYY